MRQAWVRQLWKARPQHRGPRLVCDEVGPPPAVPLHSMRGNAQHEHGDRVPRPSLQSTGVRPGREALSSCGRNWQSRPMTSPSPSYRGYRFPPEIISHAVWLYHRFSLSFRDVEDLLAQRGVTVSYETIRHWCQTFGLDYARQLRRRRGGWATPGIWMKSSSRSTVDDSTCGGPWTKTATSSTSWCSHGVTAGRPRGSFARYCKDKVGHLVVWSPTSCGATPRRTAP